MLLQVFPWLCFSSALWVRLTMVYYEESGFTELSALPDGPWAMLVVTLLLGHSAASVYPPWPSWQPAPSLTPYFRVWSCWLPNCSEVVLSHGSEASFSYAFFLSSGKALRLYAEFTSFCFHTSVIGAVC